MNTDPNTCACGCGKTLPPLRPRYHVGHKPPRLGCIREDRGYETPCLIAQGKPNRADDGYIVRSRSANGVVEKWLVHRRAWEETHGPIPPGMQVHHRCGQPACCEPTHLDLKSPADHVRLGRAAKLTVEQVREIRASPRTAVALAAEYGVTAYSVRNVRKGKTWAGVE